MDTGLPPSLTPFLLPLAHCLLFAHSSIALKPPLCAAVSRRCAERSDGPDLFPHFPAIKKFIRLDVGLLQDRSQCSFWHISRVIRNRCLKSGLRVIPDFVTAGGLPIKSKSKAPETFDNAPVVETGPSASFSLPRPTVFRTFPSPAAVSISPCVRPGPRAASRPHRGQALMFH